MERIKKIVLVCLMVVSVYPNAAWGAGNKTKRAEQTANFDWNPVMDAIIVVESNGNRLAKNGNQIGAMQITPILVAECNQILKNRKSDKRYKLSDRFSVEKSKEMFLLIQSEHNPTNDVEKAIRSWNGGQRYKTRTTQRYYEKVMRAMR